MKPLEGVRVLTVEQFGAGPYGSLFLADLGAEVIKIENAATKGDTRRHVGPHFLGDERQRLFPDLRTPTRRASRSTSRARRARRLSAGWSRHPMRS